MTSQLSFLIRHQGQEHGSPFCTVSRMSTEEEGEDIDH